MSPLIPCVCAATMRALYDDAWDKAKRARVNQRMMRNARKDRRTHDRAFANVRQALNT